MGSEFGSGGDSGDIPSRLVFQDESHITILSLPEQIEKVQLRERGFEGWIIDENSVI